ncbi:MAG: hypothetical protein GT601_03315 [Acidaminobacter sp.]|uniref:DUF7670 domain-containing protein n=1 Tax=Acidaminobacter sp. TaxID=1872102 RepID=UPI001384032A|nr:hypothetical protein [Acidaminobacter sp.]MZQ96685.1 hypothetical protein [Acidaminobacter sp.]
MSQPISKFEYWTPRLLSLAFVAFLMLFSLDVITPEATLKEILIGLFMHNIPALILLGLTLVAWRHELVGAVVFVLAGLVYIGFTIYNGVPFPMNLTWSLTLAGPAFLIGFLYYRNWREKHHPVSR